MITFIKLAALACLTMSAIVGPVMGDYAVGTYLLGLAIINQVVAAELAA